MQLTQFKTLDAGRRVQGFLDRLFAALGYAVAAAVRARLDKAVAQLAAYQLEQGMSRGTALGETSSQAALRQSIYDRFMSPICTIAKRLLPLVPEYDRLTITSLSLYNGRVGEFYTDANNLADASAKYEALLIDNGLPKDFIAQLRAAIGQLDASSGAREDHLVNKVKATAGLGEMDKAVRDAIAILNAVLKPILKANPTIQAEWAASKRIKQTAVTPNPTGSAGTSDGSVASTPTAPATPATPGASAPVLSIADGTKAAA